MININIEIIKLFLYSVLSINIVLFLIVIIKKIYFLRINEKRELYQDYLIENFENDYLNIVIKRKYQKKAFLNIMNAIIFNPNQKKAIESIIKNNDLDKMYTKNLDSKNSIKRKEAIIFLEKINDKNCNEALKKTFFKEKNYSVKLYLANTFSRLNMSETLNDLIKSLISSPDFYQEKLRNVILSFNNLNALYLYNFFDYENYEIKKLLIDYLSKRTVEKIMKYVIEISKNEPNLEIKRYAVKSLAKNYYQILNSKDYLKNKDLEIRKIAIKSLSEYYGEKTIILLLEYLKDPETKDVAMFSISQIIRKSPKYLYFVVSLFRKEKNSELKESIAKILSFRMEYFINQILTNKKETAKEIIREILLSGISSELIVVLNKTNDRNLKNEILPILNYVCSVNSQVKKELALYLNKDILEELNLKREEQEDLPRLEKNEFNKTLFQLLILFITLVIPIIHYTSVYGKYARDIKDFFHVYVIYFNYYFGFYFIVINLISLLLLFFSILNKNRQYNLWHIKNDSLLFSDKMLPSISIIAPAYNEESNIIESVNSLMNVNYPNYQLIVVNDGSKDNTLSELIKYFYLEKTDYIISKKLKTRPVRGVYKNEELPNLIVIDKENGGKADSLNVGINFSSNDYVCGIDADSILEKDALLKITSLSLDSNKEIVAIGGNIIPVNGCSLDKGFFNEIKIPKNNIAKFQIVEYIRAFLAGRLGWAQINSLMIISGAFGLFKREIVEKVGGYLTESEKYGKNTVGEDMEIVIRIASEMHENNIPFKIDYCYNANCWTEVPEDLNILIKQRDRWQRGLIDILNFHKRKIFNFKYGNMGLIGMPYYLIIETIGPIIETKGYLLVLLGIILGVLNLNILAFLFTSSILFGISVSLSAFIIAEDETNRFSLKDTLRLVLYSILENFGFRQLMSSLRFVGFLNSLRNVQGWGKMKRKGFNK